mmetsp:Transcript_6760/g.16487  ORF Transcript_6760/g.16487 Transcript_6760/m.16487 type:complete len:297 (-) Transcript_6760:1736-2626(-)
MFPFVLLVIFKSHKLRSFPFRLHLHRKFCQVLHKDTQRDIVRIHGGSLAAPIQIRVVRRGGIQSCHEETRLRFVLIADHESGDGRAGVHNEPCIGLGGLQELPKGGVFLPLLVALFAPCGNRFSVKDHHLKKRVQQQNGIGAHAVRVQQDRLGRPVEAIRKQSGLDHNQGIGRVLLDQIVTMSRCLIGTAIKDVQELGSPEMEHELRVHAELRCEAEGARIVRSILGKFRTQPNQRSIHPSKNIGNLVCVCLVNSQSCRQDCRSLLIEGSTHGRILGIKVGRSSVFGGGRIVPRPA